MTLSINPRAHRSMRVGFRVEVGLTCQSNSKYICLYCANILGHCTDPLIPFCNKIKSRIPILKNRIFPHLLSPFVLATPKHWLANPHTINLKYPRDHLETIQLPGPSIQWCSRALQEECRCVLAAGQSRRTSRCRDHLTLNKICKI